MFRHNPEDLFSESDKKPEIHSKNPDIAKEAIQHSVKHELNSLKSDLGKHTETQQILQEFLTHKGDEAYETDKNVIQTERASYHAVFDSPEPQVTYSASRAVFGDFIDRCEESRLGTHVARDVAGFLCGALDSGYQMGVLALDVSVDLLRCLVSLKSEFQRTLPYISSSTNSF